MWGGTWSAPLEATLEVQNESEDCLWPAAGARTVQHKRSQIGFVQSGYAPPPEAVRAPIDEERAGRSLRRRGQEKFRRLAEAIPYAIFVIRATRLHYVNHAAEAVTGYMRKELLQMSFHDLFQPDSREPLMSWAHGHQEEIGHGSQCEVRILTKSHQERWIDITATPIDFDGERSVLISAFDLTNRKRAEEQAQLLAITDPLTGLGNYRRIFEVLRAEIERSRRTQRPFAILLLDLDGLKKINDSHGHMVGSRALQRVGDVIRFFCRAIDTAARYGGDEFAVILPETGARAAASVASRICERIATDNEEPPLSASAGVAVYPRDGETIEALLETTDRELYRMKRRGVEQTSLLAAV